MSDDGQSSGSNVTSGSPNYQAWRDIRDRSVADFVNTVARTFDASMNRALRSELYDAVFSNGMGAVRWLNITYTGPMLLDLYYRSRKEQRL